MPASVPAFQAICEGRVVSTVSAWIHCRSEERNLLRLRPELRAFSALIEDFRAVLPLRAASGRLHTAVPAPRVRVMVKHCARVKNE